MNGSPIGWHRSSEHWKRTPGAATFWPMPATKEREGEVVAVNLGAAIPLAPLLAVLGADWTP